MQTVLDLGILNLGMAVLGKSWEVSLSIRLALKEIWVVVLGVPGAEKSQPTMPKVVEPFPLLVKPVLRGQASLLQLHNSSGVDGSSINYWLLNCLSGGSLGGSATGSGGNEPLLGGKASEATLSATRLLESLPLSHLSTKVNG